MRQVMDQNEYGDVEKMRLRFLALQRRLKEERLFVKNEKDQIRCLNEKVLSLSQDLFYIEWKNRQHWNNIDRLITGKATPADCSATSIIIDSMKFEDSCSHLDYQDNKYGKFLLDFKQNPKLVAAVLNYCDVKRVHSSTRQLTGAIISTLYGNCTLAEDEILVLNILEELMKLQVIPCEDLLSFFCGKRSTENAFASLLTMFLEVLFSSKLYLTAALHGAVMQVIVDDAIFLDCEVSKVLSRLTPKAMMEKFGKPGTPSTHSKIKEHMAVLHGKVIRLCQKFLKNLFDKVYCFPLSLRWVIGHLYQGMLMKMKLPPANAKAVIGYIIISYFVCPAIINPEPYGINSDADISETARYNLSQIASVLRSLALLECGLKDEKLKALLSQFEQGVIMSYVSSLLVGEDMDISESNDRLTSYISKTSLLTTEHNLMTLINCLKILQSYNIYQLNEEGLDELLNNLPPTPARWRYHNNERLATTLPNLNASPDSSFSPLNTSFKNLTMDQLPGAFDNSLLVNQVDELNELRKDLNTVIEESEVVLVIPLGMQSDSYPGMLSEEKVLGLESNHPHSASYDMDMSAADRGLQASSLIADALREKLSVNDPIGISISSVSSTFSACELSSAQSEPIDIQFDYLDSVFSDGNNNNNNNNLQVNNVPIDNLLDIDADNDDRPALPEKKRDKSCSTLNDMEPPLPIKKGSSLLFDKCSSVQLQDNKSPMSKNIEPLIELEEKLEDSQLSFNVTPVNTHRKTLSEVSMVSGEYGLNAILKSATMSSPKKSGDLPDAWLQSVPNEADPWGAIKSTTINGDSITGFENDFQPVITPIRKGTPPSDVRFSLMADYSAYSEHILEEHRRSTMNNANSVDQDAVLQRKEGKSVPNERFIDKISNRLVASLRQTHAKTDTPVMKRDSFNDKIYASLNPMQSDTKNNLAPYISRSPSISTSSGSASSSESANIGEAILEKYRNMKDMSTDTLDNLYGSSPSFQSNGMQHFEQDIVFDDVFKFDDAKRKLRSVLSKTDLTILPSDATSFDHLLITTLQLKYAEAINLQDRFSVAQYHESMRSIKQLPKGSCLKLLEVMEAEYDERAKYIAYLIRSKQGLLSTISNLEHLLTKVKRDKVVCCKYFTTVSVRFYLEFHERKQEILAFAQKFASSELVDEKCAHLNEFLSSLHREMLTEPTWMYCSEEQAKELAAVTERAIISKIYKDAFHPNSSADCQNDQIFHDHVKYLSNVVTLSHPALQIPKMYQKEAPWSSAQTELLMVNAYKTPADKLACIHRCCVTIMNLLSMAADKKSPGADDFLPVLVYVVLQANPPNMLSTKQYVNNFYETRLTGEEYYCWMQFCAAIEFIKTLRTPDT